MGNTGGKCNGIEQTEAICPRPHRGTCARYMFDKYGPDSVRDIANWCEWTMNGKLPFPENGTFDRDCLNHLRKMLEEKGKDKRTSRHVHWGAYMEWMEACRDRVEKTRLLNLKGQLDQVTMHMPMRLENKSKKKQ